MRSLHPWFAIKEFGLYCIPGDFYIDPTMPVPCAIITHCHSDHARSGHCQVIAETTTIALMRLRYGAECAEKMLPLTYFEKINIKKVSLYLLPAGHILGSAQIVIEYEGLRFIISGDYKRSTDPTCESFVVEPCDIFITEATFGLPVFNHPPIEQELNKLLTSLQNFPDRCHLIGVYALGKCQRVIKVLRHLGYNSPIYVHGALKKLCDFYEDYGIELGDVRLASSLDLSSSKGTIVLCPPSALREQWSRRFAHVVRIMASGWMQIRARAKQKGIELPLIISDHADWPELTRTIQEVNPKAIWVTHGREEALVYYAQQQGIQAQSLHLLGYEEED